MSVVNNFDHENKNENSSPVNENPPHGNGTGSFEKAPGERNEKYNNGTGPDGNGQYVPIATDDPHSYTVLRVVAPKESLLTKRFTKDSKWVSYGGREGDEPGAYMYSARTVDILSLDALEAELRLLDKEPSCCFVAGAIVDGSDRNNMRRIKYDHKRIDKKTKKPILDKKTGQPIIDKQTLRDVPRYLIPLDVDSLPCPDGIDARDLTAAASYIRSQLPPVFRNVACVAQATSGHCIKDGLRFRIFFMSHRPLTSQEIKTWLAQEKAPVDFSIYGANAVVYTATCVFDNPDHDPLPNGRIVRLDGDESVTTPDADYFASKSKRPSPSRDKGEKIVCEGDWREIQEALAHIPADDYETWLYVGMALQWAQYHSDDQDGTTGFELWDEWSQGADNYDADAIEGKWDSFDPERGGKNGPIKIGFVFTRAREHGWQETQLDDQAIRQRINELHLKTESLDKLSAEYTAIQEQAIELFARSSDNYRGVPAEQRFFYNQWRMNAKKLRGRLEAYDKKHPKSKPKPAPEDSTGLIFGRNGPISNVHNAYYLLTNEPEMRGVFRFNEMTLEVEISRHVPGCEAFGDFPRTLEENDKTQTVRWLQKHRLDTISRSNTEDAIEDVARLDSYHPIRDWLRTLVWDGVSRLDDWLFTYGKAKLSKDPEQAEKERVYIRKIGPWFLLQMVARIEIPGSQADYVLTPKGMQGYEKSKLGRTLAGDKHFTDNLPRISNEANALRKLGLHLKGRWLVELSERASVAEIEDYKAFITRRVDKYQGPFGRREVDQPRQCCFVSTTNDDTPLRDITGNRRDWVFESDGFDIPALTRDRDQLFAEAFKRYSNGERYWPTHEEQATEFNVQQDANLLTEPWQEMLDGCLSQFESVEGVCLPSESILDCLKDRIGMAPYPNKYGAFLRRKGWTNETVRIQSRAGIKKRFWRRVDQNELWKCEDDEGNIRQQVTPQFLEWKPRSQDALGRFRLTNIMPGSGEM